MPARWFEASEALGAFMGIRYGRIPCGTNEVEWFHVPYVECDGVGGSGFQATGFRERLSNK